MRFYRHKEYLVRGAPGISSIFSFFFGFPLKERGKIQKRIGSNKKRILLFSSVSPRVRWSKSASKRRSLVRSVDLPWFLQLDLQPLHPDLETIHRLYRSLRMRKFSAFSDREFSKNKIFHMFGLLMYVNPRNFA